MWFATVINAGVTIGVGVMVVWGWVALISEAIARRTGTTYKVPYHDEVVWALFGRFLLDLGLFGGAFALKQRLQGSLLRRWLTGRRLRSEDIELRCWIGDRKRTTRGSSQRWRLGGWPISARKD